jgi:hypothetical protein
VLCVRNFERIARIVVECAIFVKEWVYVPCLACCEHDKESSSSEALGLAITSIYISIHNIIALNHSMQWHTHSAALAMRDGIIIKIIIVFNYSDCLIHDI